MISREVVLHVGMGRCGTSTVQFFLRDNRARLADRGVLFPHSPGGARHGRLSLLVAAERELLGSPQWARAGATDPARFRRDVRRRLLAEVEAAALPRVLLTDEVLWRSPDPALRRLGRFTRRLGERLRVLVYLRRQDDHLVSSYAQRVKVGWVERLDAWPERDWAGLYDYPARLRALRDRVGPDELVVRRYEPALLGGGSLLQDFLDAAGVVARVEELQPVENRNASLDADSVELLRLVNLYRVEHEGAVPGMIDNRELAARLTAASAGPVLSLPAPVLDAFMQRWEEPNRAVAREVFGAETLFRTPRRTHDTTTEQRLDPSRLGHLLEVGELPEAMHGPLRRLAEREAAR